eukprot:TRINITY_DN4259_c0_g1_i1.p3 TRINITY_DN4259_c0_g1~~TRINITY_DN4259_c0_g1_i1.p3  ORF type:complete len:100 (+),score=11.80 TRINITY_DN4259_c0_g1_i1:1106-1405(+)
MAVAMVRPVAVFLKYFVFVAVAVCLHGSGLLEKTAVVVIYAVVVAEAVVETTAVVNDFAIEAVHKVAVDIKTLPFIAVAVNAVLDNFGVFVFRIVVKEN